MATQVISKEEVQMRTDAYAAQLLRPQLKDAREAAKNAKEELEKFKRSNPKNCGVQMAALAKKCSTAENVAKELSTRFIEQERMLKDIRASCEIKEHVINELWQSKATLESGQTAMEIRIAELERQNQELQERNRELEQTLNIVLGE